VLIISIYRNAENKIQENGVVTSWFVLCRLFGYSVAIMKFRKMMEP